MPASIVSAAGERLLERWREPHRRYHDVHHLAAVLDALALLATDSGAPTRPEVLLAAWFHDAVYQGRPGDDEEASAVLAQRVLAELGLPAGVIAEVARLVRLTSTHDPEPGDIAGALLVDADLAVLAGAPADYDRYARAVREEYRHVPDKAFRSGRAAVLTSLLDKPFLYRTDAGRARWEAAARANVTAELTLLRTP